MELNIAENRNHLNYSKWIYVKRILWTFGKIFFRNSPRIAFGYRNTILRLFGAKIGKQWKRAACQCSVQDLVPYAWLHWLSGYWAGSNLPWHHCRRQPPIRD